MSQPSQPAPPTVDIEVARAAASTLTLAEATARAEQHAAAGDLPAAVAELSVPLASLDTNLATPLVVDAAALYARVLGGTGDLAGALQWGTYAYRLGRSLYGPRDPRAVRPTQVFATVLADTGNNPQKCVAVYRDLVDLLTTVDGPTGWRTLAARADLAVALHRRGACDVAHFELESAWTAQAANGERDALAIRMLARLAVMYRDCDDEAQADRLFGEAQGFCDTGTTLAGTVADASRRPADLVHNLVCTHHPDSGPRPPTRTD